MAQVEKKVALGYRSLGPQTLKNIPDPVEVFAIQGDGLATSDDRQAIHYCRTPDGVRLHTRSADTARHWSKPATG
jgi:hypothetical protein